MNEWVFTLISFNKQNLPLDPSIFQNKNRWTIIENDPRTNQFNTI